MTAKKAQTHQDYATDGEGYVHIKAPKGGDVVTVRPESVEVWLEDGWTVVDDDTEAVTVQPKNDGRPAQPKD